MRPPLAIFALLLLCSGLAAALHAKPPESNCLGEYRPDILLEREMVQGRQITPDDLDGKVVFFMFYRRDCYGCEFYAMPRLHALYDRYRENRCALVFAINTAFDKDEHPDVADIKVTRDHLKLMGWEMPVARDFDELSVEMFELDGISGTPQVVVLDQRGTVRAHDWYSTEAEWTHLEATFERLVANTNCDCHTLPRQVTEGCGRSYNAFKEGDYKKAWDEADAILNSPSYNDKDRADAEYLKKFVEDLADRHFRKIEDDFSFDPDAAIQKAAPVIEKFQGVPGTVRFADKVNAWKDSPAVSDFRRAKADLERLEGGFAKLDPKDETGRQKYVKDLEAIVAKTGNNAVGARARHNIAVAKGEPLPAANAKRIDAEAIRGKAGNDPAGTKPAGNARNPEARPSAPPGNAAKARVRESNPGAPSPSAKSSSEAGSRTATSRSRHPRE